MSHLTTNSHHAYLGDEFELVITLDVGDLTATDVTSPVWTMQDGLSKASDDLTVSDGDDGVEVQVPLTAADTAELKASLYRWQLVADVDGQNQVVAVGQIKWTARL